MHAVLIMSGLSHHLLGMGPGPFKLRKLLIRSFWEKLGKPTFRGKNLINSAFLEFCY
jgi:hypothetical protein